MDRPDTSSTSADRRPSVYSRRIWAESAVHTAVGSATVVLSEVAPNVVTTRLRSVTDQVLSGLRTSVENWPDGHDWPGPHTAS